MKSNIVKNYKDSLNNFRSLLLKNSDNLSEENIVKYDRLNKLFKNIDEEVKNIWKFNNKEINTSKKIFFKQTQNKLIDKYLPDTNIKLRFNEGLINFNIKDSIKRNILDLSSKIKNEIMNIVRNEESLIKADKNIKVILEKNIEKVLNIENDQIHKVKSIAEIEFEKVLDKNGIKYKKIWRTSNDDRVRDTHNMMEGVEADKDGYFAVPYSGGYDYMLAPGTGSIPEANINCRCYVDLIMEKEDE